MDNDKFQELVLQTLAQLTEGQKSLEAGQKSLAEGQKSLEDRQKLLEEGQQKIENEVRAIRESQVRFEQEITDKVRVLYDAREVQADVNVKILSTLGRIEAKVDVLQMETSNIRRIK